VVPEAPLEQTETGLVPAGEGWFVLNAKDARWFNGHFGAATMFQSPEFRFPQVGVNIGVLQPGQPACMYHGEEDQEGFLILSGECLLLVEGQERRLRRWDFFHCPPWTEHVLVGAGDGPCVVLAVGARAHDGLVYPAAEFAQKHGAAVQETVHEGKLAYADFPKDELTAYREGWLPE
jgi:uncharacterized cupin superfamily protein